MNIDWKAFTGGLSGGLRELRGGAPEVMKGFSEIAQAALKTDALGTKTKELIALAVATCMSWTSLSIRPSTKRTTRRA